MSKDLVTTDELAFLAKKNKEMMVEEWLTSELNTQMTTMFEQALEAGLQASKGLKEGQFKSIQLKDSQCTSNPAILPTLEENGIMVLAQTQPDQGQHLVVVRGETQESVAVETLTDLVSDLVTTIYQEVSNGLTLDMNVEVLAAEYGRLDELETLKQFDLNQYMEVHQVQLTLTDESLVQMWLISDVNYLEKTCKALLPQATAETNQDVSTVPASQDEHAEVYKPVFQPLTDASGAEAPADLKVLSGVSLEISAVLGRTKCSIQDLLELNVGAIVELDKLIDEPIEIYANNKQIAEGELVVIEDNFGVKLTRLIK